MALAVGSRSGFVGAVVMDNDVVLGTMAMAMAMAMAELDLVVDPLTGEAVPNPENPNVATSVVKTLRKFGSIGWLGIKQPANGIAIEPISSANAQPPGIGDKLTIKGGSNSGQIVFGTFGSGHRLTIGRLPVSLSATNARQPHA